MFNVSSSSKALVLTWLKAIGLLVATISLFFSAQFIGLLLLVIVLRLTGLHGGDLTDALDTSILLQFFAVLLVEMLVVGVLYYIFTTNNLSFFKKFRLSRKPSVIDVVKVLLTYGVYVLSFIIIVSILPLIVPSVDIEQAQSLGFNEPEGSELLLVFASLVILPAIAEEILFRGFLYQGLKRYLRSKTAIIITSVLFGIAHLEFLSGGSLNYIAAVDTMLFSVFLILVFEKTRNLWSAVLLHAVKNSVAFIVLFLI